jgi:hypothetical protein
VNDETKTKPLDPRCRYVVQEVTVDEVTEEKSYILTPIGEYPGRDVEVGDIFSPVGYDPARAK